MTEGSTIAAIRSRRASRTLPASRPSRHRRLLPAHSRGRRRIREPGTGEFATTDVRRGRRPPGPAVGTRTSMIGNRRSTWISTHPQKGPLTCPSKSPIGPPIKRMSTGVTPVWQRIGQRRRGSSISTTAGPQAPVLAHIPPKAAKSAGSSTLGCRAGFRPAYTSNRHGVGCLGQSVPPPSPSCGDQRRLRPLRGARCAVEGEDGSRRSAVQERDPWSAPPPSTDSPGHGGPAGRQTPPAQAENRGLRAGRGSCEGPFHRLAASQAGVPYSMTKATAPRTIRVKKIAAGLFDPWPPPSRSALLKQSPGKCVGAKLRSPCLSPNPKPRSRPL
jgi:hypothetical protein